MSGKGSKGSWKTFLTGEKAGAHGSKGTGSGVFDWKGNERRFKSVLSKAKIHKSIVSRAIEPLNSPIKLDSNPI